MIEDDLPASITIVVTVREETGSQTKWPRVEDGVRIQAQADALAKASDHFRASVHGGAKVSTPDIVHVEVST